MADKYHVFVKALEAREVVDDADPRLAHPDAMKNLLKEHWDFAVTEGYNPIEVRVGEQVALDLMAELNTYWEAQGELAELCRPYGEFLVRYDPAAPSPATITVI